MTQTLIQRQDATLSLMAEQRSSQRRRLRMQARAVGKFCRQSEKLGYTIEQVNQQARDLWDMHYLNEAAT